MNETILLTGATGFLGTWIARELLRATDAQLAVLVRAKNDSAAAAAARLRRAWWDHPDLAQSIGERVQVIAGDIARPGLGLPPEVHDRLTRTLTRIIHCAADLRLNGPLDEMRGTNVQGTKSLLELAHAAHRHHGLSRFVHVSTAYVAGNRRGHIREEDLTDAYGFVNNYERTKYEGETLVRAAMKDLPCTILRPGLVVGDSSTGAIHTFNTLYYPLRLYLAERHRVLPARPCLRVNMVPVDWVAEMAVRLALDPRAGGLAFHLTAPSESLPTAAEMAAFVHDWARRNLDSSMQRPVFVPVPSPLAGLATKLLGGRLSELASYFGEQRVFHRENLDLLAGPYAINWREYLPNLLSYATRCGFAHRRGRTVHEQILFRLGSRSYPAIFHDIVRGRFIRRTADELRSEIMQVAAALRASGIRPGDRVGITGLNSTRYSSLDAAIGLVGAVSVPIYYTSPPEEVRAILADSGARMLLLGAPALLPGLSELAREFPVVSFCRQTPPRSASDFSGFVRWEEFLARGGSGEGITMAPVDPDDLATIRYTSGTTGPPKGVAFTHRQLRWMAEAVGAIAPWRIRTRPVRYLSFLPLSHVVEGILGAYTPFCGRIRLRIDYLEDFTGLRLALRKTRPTFFFCVPRFYEKLWEKASGTWLGRWWLRAPRSRVGRLIRPVLRRIVLGRAGLARCDYLVVGSAPVREELLKAFADLGIEVHNAYGLTEAPLVTINRRGRILEGTVGEPLPETEIRVADDGEILVRGPQGACGYYGKAGLERFHPGDWLHTGDFGRLGESGGLVVSGRKKDLIVTSYGKNVNPLKVENELRRLPGIKEAMLIGEGRPYCAALLWVDPARAANLDWEELDREMQAANGRLAHPEQVKSWAVLPYDLSVAAGDLTANLKLRRERIAGRAEDVLAALYAVGGVPNRVLHLGRVRP